MYYSPVRHFTTPKSLSCDLHVLGAPPAFVLSQDQTLNNVLLLTNKGRHFNTLLLVTVFFGYLVVKEQYDREALEDTKVTVRSQG